MVDKEKAAQAALRVVPKDSPHFPQVCETFEKNAGYGDEFLAFHKERDALLEKIAAQKELDEKEQKLIKKVDKDLEALLEKAPDGHVHGYLISVGHVNVLDLDPIAVSAMSVFYKEDPTFFHELAKFFDPGGPDFFPVRKILTNNSIFSDMLKLYLDRARNYKTGDYATAEWLENLFQQLNSVASEISLVELKGQKVKDKIKAYHRERFPKKVKQ